MTKIISLLVLLFLLNSVASAEPAVVVHPSQTNYKIHRQDLRYLFSLRTRTWSNGAPVILVMLPFDSLCHKKFVESILYNSVGHFNETFNGRKQIGNNSTYIKTALTCQDSIDVVASTPGSIGYTNAYLLLNDNDDVRKIEIVD